MNVQVDQIEALHVAMKAVIKRERKRTIVFHAIQINYSFELKRQL